VTVERAAFVGAMRRVANSVAVVTTDGAEGRHGATVSSFCSVSADPPSLLVCLRADARIARVVRCHGTFCVNVLKDSAGGLAERFAGRTETPLADRFAGVRVLPEPAPFPVLEDAVSAFACRVTEVVESGTHVIIVGEVLEVRASRERPLAYLDGGYGSVVPHTPS
jgi:flavin reductase (DIM6/NTAB) family NADH-FMN oxidoreductase RutF